MDEILYLNQKKDFQKKNHSLKEKNKLEEASMTQLQGPETTALDCQWSPISLTSRWTQPWMQFLTMHPNKNDEKHS